MITVSLQTTIHVSMTHLTLHGLDIRIVGYKHKEELMKWSASDFYLSYGFESFTKDCSPFILSS